MLKKLKSRSKKNQKGFTLVELLAVLVILAIIAAIAVPIISNIVQAQRAKGDVQDALNIIHAAKLYETDGNTIPDDGVGYDVLKEYIGHTSDEDQTFTVKVSDGVYSISGHDANAVDGGTDPMTEQQLVDQSE